MTSGPIHCCYVEIDLYPFLKPVALFQFPSQGPFNKFYVSKKRKPIIIFSRPPPPLKGTKTHLSKTFIINIYKITSIYISDESVSVLVCQCVSLLVSLLFRHSVSCQDRWPYDLGSWQYGRSSSQLDDFIQFKVKGQRSRSKNMFSQNSFRAVKIDSLMLSRS